MRSRRWLLGVGAVLLSTVVTVGTGGAAEAVATFSPTKTVGNNCYFAYSATSTSGQTRGVMGCESGSSSEIVFFRGNGTAAWTRVRTGVRGIPLAFADDGTSYYAVYQAVTATGTTVKLLKRNRSTGTVTNKTLVTSTAAWMPDAAVVARAGKYWAAISRTDEAGTATTYTRQTLDPSLPAMKAVDGWRPALALRGTNRVTMVVSSDQLGSGANVWRYLPQADGTWKRSTIRAGVAFLPTVQYSGGVTRIAWLEMVNELGVFKTVYADNSSGAFVRRTLPGPAAWPASSPFITVNQGKLTVGWTARNSDTPLKWTRTGIAQRVGGTWTSRTVGHGLTDANLAGLGAFDGKVVTVMAGGTSAGGLKVTSRRQP